jgi:hypothetical protein
MDWQGRISSLIDGLERVAQLKWLAASALVVAIVLLIALLVVFARYVELRQRLSSKSEPSGQGFVYSALPSWEELGPPMSLEGEGRALIDRLLPRRPRNFLLAVAALALGCWIAGLTLSADAYAFFTSREWQVQPLYLAAHFITLRLFGTMFTRNFMEGIAYLDVPPALARHGIWLVLGPVGALVALVLAIPFSIYEYRTLLVSDVTSAGSLGYHADLLLYGIWCAEWFLIAFIWVQLVGFLLLTRWAIREHRFRAPIEIVLHDKQYRPFLQMSAQGATIVLGFFAVNAVYTWYTGAEMTDYIGVAVTLILLVVGFIPPWMLLTAKVDRIVSEEMTSLRRRLSDSGVLAEPQQGGSTTRTIGDIEKRLDEALVMLRISYLERLYRDLGQIEATSIFVKVIVPAVTLLYYVLKYLRLAP